MISLSTIGFLLKSKWKKLIPYIVIVILLLTAFFFFNRARHYRGEFKRQTQNIEVLQSDLEISRDSYGREHAKVGTIRVKYKELEKFNIDIAEKWNLTKRQLKRTQRLIEIERQTKGKIVTVLKDTTIYRDGITPIPAMTSTYSDKYFSAGILLIADTLTINYIHNDIVLGRIFIGRKEKVKFWFWKWRLTGERKYGLEVISDNPKTKTIKVRDIEIVK